MRRNSGSIRTLAGVMTLSLLCFSNAGTAFSCPSPPVQVGADTKLEVRGHVGTWKKLISSGGTVQFEKKVQELYSKYPNAERLVLSNLMISIFCEQLKVSEELDEKTKFDLIFEFNERVMNASSENGGREKYLGTNHISFLQQAFSDDDPNAARIALGKALDSRNEFMQNLALKAMFGGKKKLYSGHLIHRKKQTPFMLEIKSFSESDSSLIGQFVGWNEKFRGQLTGTTLVVVGTRYSFSTTLTEEQVLKGDTWQGCLSGSPQPGCVGYEGTVIRLF